MKDTNETRYRVSFICKYLQCDFVDIIEAIPEVRWCKIKKDIYNGDYQTECDFYTDVLIKNGVPREAILCEDKSGHTRDNAFFSRKLADENGLVINKAIVCCKSFHARRCLMLYQLAFPKTEILIVPVDCYGIGRDHWYKMDYGIDRVLGELARCGNQFVGDIKEYLKCQK